MNQILTSLDHYEFLRNAYVQRREYLVHDGNPPGDEEDFLEDDLGLDDDLGDEPDEVEEPDPTQDSEQTDL